jgi:uncharacterized protein YabN with tetrapyrrole methylase and pyrophosphatase domain
VAETPDAVVSNWETIKKAEKSRTSVTDGIPNALPALALAAKLLRKASAVGLPEEDRTRLQTRLEAQLGALPEVAGDETPLTASAVGSPLERQMGELFLALTDLSQRLGVEPEAALRGAALALRDQIVERETT